METLIKKRECEESSMVNTAEDRLVWIIVSQTHHWSGS